MCTYSEWRQHMKIAVKEAGKELCIIETAEIYQRNCVKEHIGKGNYPEFVRLDELGTLSLGVSDDGLLRNLPFNFYVSCKNPYFPVQKMVGTAVFVRTKFPNVHEEEIFDYEVMDLTEEDIALIQELLSEKTQKELHEHFILTDRKMPIGFIPVRFDVIYQLHTNLAMILYQNTCAFLSKNIDTFSIPLYFLREQIEEDKKLERYEKTKSEEEILKEACADISQKANISLEYVKSDQNKAYFSLEKTVIIL